MRFTRFLSRPFRRLLLQTMAAKDPWTRYAYGVPLHVYGLGARRDFRWYFEGESAVAIRSVEDVQDWLLGCEYARDPDLFQEADFWQHPRTFEHLRKGDCEDFSLWTWRKLVRMGYDAEFVAGQSLVEGHTLPHTFVVYREGTRTLLFDPVIRDRGRMIRPLKDVAASYVPEVSVDGSFARYAYLGYFLRHQQPREAAPAPSVTAALPI